jgi:hypothetical protein
MPVYRTLLALLVGVSLSLGAELRTLKGEKITGELVSLSDKEVVLAKGGDKVTVDVKQVVEISGLGTDQRIPGDARYLAVELTDGSILSCGNLNIKGKQVELTLLLTGQAVKVPLAAVANVLADANQEKYRKDWRDRVKKNRTRDVLALVKDDVVNALEGLLGEGDEEGKTIAFTLASGKKVNIPQENIHGMIFKRTLDAQAPAVRFKLTDAYKDVVMVSSAASGPTGLTVTTPSGTKLEYALTQLTKLDYSTDKIAYLSDLEPSRPPVLSSNVGAEPTIGKDRNPFSNDPIRIGGRQFPKGLVLRAFTEIEYDLGGEYSIFKASVGVDDSIVATEHKTKLLVYRDGEKVADLTVNRKDKERPKELTLNVKDARKLKIVVTSDDWVDLGKHVTLADAMVSK